MQRRHQWTEAQVRAPLEPELDALPELLRATGAPAGWDRAELRRYHQRPELFLHVAAASSGPPPGDLPACRWAALGLLGVYAGSLVCQELEVHFIGVVPAARRTGVGELLLREALSEATGRGATAAFIEVRAGNRAALGLYERCGFEEVGRRPRYYGDTGEDALLFRRDL